MEFIFDIIYNILSTSQTFSQTLYATCSHEIVSCISKKELARLMSLCLHLSVVLSSLLILIMNLLS